jgi:hypothetical protein
MKNPVRINQNGAMGKNSGGLSRRNFISSCGCCAACAALAPLSFLDSTAPVGLKKEMMKIKVIYSLHSTVQNQPDWPNTGFDFAPPMEKFNSALQKNFKDIQFIPVTATGPEDAEKIVQQDKAESIDGYIVFQMNCWNRVVQTIAETGKPVLYADFQFGGSGGFLVYTAAFMKGNYPNVGFVASSKIEDLLAAVKCFGKTKETGQSKVFAKAATEVRTMHTPPAGKINVLKDVINPLSAEECIYRLKQSKILAVRDQKALVAEPLLGIPLEYIPFSEVNAAWSSADRDESRSVAEKWQRNAESVTDVPFSTLETSAAMYLGMKNVLADHGANAITMNCLGGFYGGHIHAYPCLGFHELCNEGLVGGCECDVNSAATMLAFSTLTSGRPGYISDPVIDTSKRQIIYAHCVASNKVFGPKGQTNPFTIMTHSEDRQGASVRSVLPVNYLTTTLEISQERKEILFHQAIAVANDPDDRACRTKLCAEPTGDIEKLFTMWDTWGWHRVTFYGDLREPVNAFAGVSGWKVVEEA